MKTILILGAGKEQLYAIKLANQKKIRTVVFDKDPKAVGVKYADEFYPISTRNIEEIIKFLKKYSKRIDGVMTIASDIPHCVSAAAEFLNVQHIPLSVAETCIHKYRMKEMLRNKGVTVPDFGKISSLNELKSFISRVGYPIVIKPVDNSGARGVLRLTKKEDLRWAFDYARQFSFSGQVMAEKFINGLQISTEGLMVNGVFYCTGFGDRNYARIEQTSPYLVEDGGDLPTVLGSREKKEVIEEFEKAILALGINWGPAKGDMVFGTDGKVYVIEIAARLSGGNFCYDKVPWSTGVDIVDILIDMSVGNQIDIKKLIPTKNMATSQRYFFPLHGKIKSIRNITKVKNMPYIKKVDLWIKPGDIIPATVNHPSRVGYVISCAPTLKKAIFSATKAVQTIEFTMMQP